MACDVKAWSTTCTLAQVQAAVAQQAGAAGLIVVNLNNTGFFNINTDASSNAQVGIPVMGMPRLPAIPLFRSLLAGFPLTGVLKSLSLPSGAPGNHSTENVKV